MFFFFFDNVPDQLNANVFAHKHIFKKILLSTCCQFF